MRLPDDCQPVGAATPVSLAGAAGCSAPGFVTRLPAGIAAPAAGANARATVSNPPATRDTVRAEAGIGRSSQPATPQNPSFPGDRH